MKNCIILSFQVHQTFVKNATKCEKSDVLDFFPIFGSWLGHSEVFAFHQRRAKFSTNKFRMKLILLQSNCFKPFPVPYEIWADNDKISTDSFSPSLARSDFMIKDTSYSPDLISPRKTLTKNF